MLMDLLASPALGILANVMQVCTLGGVAWTIWVMHRDRQLITVAVRCEDGRRKEIGRIRGGS